MSFQVPAVVKTASILRYLQRNLDPEKCTLSQIARAVEIHKSTCTNILRTLEEEELVDYDSISKSYRLGIGLIGLGAVASMGRNLIQLAYQHMEQLVREARFTCVACERIRTGEFIVVSKVESPLDLKLTIDLGQRFPPTAPVVRRAYLAWQSKAEIEADIAKFGLPVFTPSTVSNLQTFLQRLQDVRDRGYDDSIGEYYAANTAISAPVFDPNGKVVLVLCMVVLASEITEAELPLAGERVKRAAEEITHAFGGRMPS